MRSQRVVASLAVALVTGGALVGCLPGEASPTSTPTASSSAPTRTATPSPSATPTADPESTPLSVPCDSLLSPDTMYTFDPNFALLGSFDPVPGSAAAEVQAAGGTLCRWVHGTNSVTVDVAVAELSADAASARITALDATGTAVADFGPSGYFSAANGVGQAQSFRDPYWVTVASPIFSAPGDAATLMNAITVTP